MSVNSERRLNVKIDRQDMAPLSANQFQLQVAKSVMSKGKLIFNLVWQSTILAPNTTISWKPVYGFNWTSDVPADGISVSCGGDWVQCNLGQAVDIDSNGFFVPSTVKPDPAYMMIGKNGYKPQSPDGLRIVIGVQNRAGNFEPVFVDPVSINLNMSATFQPQEELQWWYDSGSKQATMFTDHQTPFETASFSKPDVQTNTFFKTSTYNVQDGAWVTTASKCE